jgi:O-antigen ligase
MSLLEIIAAPRSRDAARALELWTAWHAAILVVAATWGFGGNIHWIRPPLAWWGTLGAALTVVGLWRRVVQPQPDWRPLLWLAPWAGLAGLVLLGTMNPSTTVTAFFERPIYRPVTPAWSWLPSSARPDLAASELWLLSGLYLTGFNLLINVQRRRVLHQLLLGLVFNGALLAVFGTLQELAGAPGLYFGAQRSPNPTFFASFIYHNHWGPFALLTMMTALGLAAHSSASDHPGHARRVPTLLMAALLLAATIPLSGSRSCTLLLLVLLVFVGRWLMVRLGDHGHRDARSRRWQLALTGGALIGAVGGMIWLSAPVLQARLNKTREQLADWREVGGLGGREILYRDTWRMARDRPWTGWGLESFETVFVRYNSATSPRDRLQVRFDQAHSDWLQAVAETGFLGTGLLLMMAVIPLAAMTPHLRLRDPLTAALGLAITVISGYAMVEFPFANPAVVLTFWILLFAALRHARLSDH